MAKTKDQGTKTLARRRKKKSRTYVAGDYLRVGSFIHEDRKLIGFNFQKGEPRDGQWLTLTEVTALIKVLTKLKEKRREI